MHAPPMWNSIPFQKVKVYLYATISEILCKQPYSLYVYQPLNKIFTLDERRAFWNWFQSNISLHSIIFNRQVFTRRIIYQKRFFQSPESNGRAYKKFTTRINKEPYTLCAKWKPPPFTDIIGLQLKRYVASVSQTLFAQGS